MANNPIFQFDSEEEAIKVLQAEGRRLKYIALKLWRKYLSEYQPKKYAKHLTGEAGKRTRDTQRGIKLGKVKKIDGDTLGIELTFENDLMYHESVFGSSKPQGHSIMLISEGWHSKKLERKLKRRIERFTYFEGIDYLARLKEEFESGKHQGITLEIQWAGSEFKKRRRQPNVLKR